MGNRNDIVGQVIGATLFAIAFGTMVIAILQYVIGDLTR
jgi:hypothetical protein